VTDFSSLPPRTDPIWEPPKESRWTIAWLALLIYGGSLFLASSAGMIWALFYEHMGSHTHDTTSRRVTTDLVIVGIAIVIFAVVTWWCDWAFSGHASEGWLVFLAVFVLGCVLAYAFGHDPHHTHQQAHNSRAAGGGAAAFGFLFSLFVLRRITGRR